MPARLYLFPDHMPSAAFLLAPIASIPDEAPDERGRETSLAPLLGYRGLGLRPVKRPRGLAPALGFAVHTAKADTFAFGLYRRDEIGMLRGLAESFGGDTVALWTFGGAVHLQVARSAAPGSAPEVHWASVRLDAPADAARPAGTAERIAGWLEGSALAPDVEALRRELAAPAVSVTRWFAAFGVPGVPEAEPLDAGAAWLAFERAAGALLAGAAPAAEDRRRVNALFDGKGSHLPAKPAAKRGATARRVAEAFAELQRTIGAPTGAPAGGRLAACAEAAALYDRITSGPAGDRLLGTARKPLAVPLALGRLLLHYPVEVRRDPLFLAAAGLEAEAWNGHGFVDPFFALAERAAELDFAAIVYPAELEQRFHADHGVRTGESSAVDGWAGEVVVGDAEGVAAAAEAFARWLAATGAEGRVVRGARGGPLDPRAAVLAGGAPDVLAPGALSEEVRAAPDDAMGAAAALEARLDVDEAAASSPLDHPWAEHDEDVAIVARLATGDEAYARAIERDLRLFPVVPAPPVVARSGTTVRLQSDSTTRAGALVRLFGDPPPGSRIAVMHDSATVVFEVRG